MAGQVPGGNRDPFLDAHGVAGIPGRCLQSCFLELFLSCETLMGFYP